MEKNKGKTIKLIGYNKLIGMETTDIIFNVVGINIRTLKRVDMVRPPKQDYIYLKSEDEANDVMSIKQIIVYTSGDKKYHILTDCKVFVMNEDGKTIDTL